MGILQTAERSTHLDPSENVIYQRHLIAYKESANLISGTVLEIGSGEGYGMIELAPKAEHYIAVDKYETLIPEELKESNNITFIQSEVPPLKIIEDESVDFVVSFQVIEHIKNDELFLQEIHRVLKPGGKAILTTPNIMMSITRSPWHVLGGGKPAGKPAGKAWASARTVPPRDSLLCPPRPIPGPGLGPGPGPPEAGLPWP